MPGLDPNIILQANQPSTQLQNPMDAMGKMMQMKSLADQSYMNNLDRQQKTQQFNDQQAMRQAYQDNTSVDQNGQVTFNRQGMMSDLAQKAPYLVPTMQQNLAQQDAARYKMAIEHLSAGAQLLNGATDEGSYQNVKQQAQAMGGDVSHWPDHYDPKQVQRLQSMALGYKDKLEADARASGLDIEQEKAQVEAKKLGVDMYKTFGNKTADASNPPDYKPAASPNQKPQLSQIDPGQFIKNAPQGLQKPLSDEVKNVQNIVKIAPDIMDAFKHASDDKHLADMVPGMKNADQKKFLALIGTTVQEAEGTTRQMAFENIEKNMMPNAFDDANTIKRKKEALAAYLTAKASSPLAVNAGIDLSKFKSTSLDPRNLGIEQKLTRPHDMAIGSTMVGKDGQTYQKTNQGWVPTNVATK